MYHPKENLAFHFPGEKWLNDTERAGAGMENPMCREPKPWECSLWCVLCDSCLGSPPCLCWVLFLALVHVLQRGCVSQGHCSSPGHFCHLCHLKNTTEGKGNLVIREKFREQQKLLRSKHCSCACPCLL